MKTAAEILAALAEGLILEIEAHTMLDTLQIRGGFGNIGTKDAKYTGFDYRRQCWLEISLAAFTE